MLYVNLIYTSMRNNSAWILGCIPVGKSLENCRRSDISWFMDLGLLQDRAEIEPVKKHLLSQ